MTTSTEIAPAAQVFPGPGIYTNVSRAEYDRWPYLNMSKLLHARKSAQHLKAALDGLIDRKTTAKEFGKAFHARLLEPSVYHQEFRVAERCHAILSSGKNAGTQCRNDGKLYWDGVWHCGTHAEPGDEEPENVISPDEAHRIELMASAVKDHPVVNLMRQHGGYEASMIWRPPGYDVTCKLRVDKWIAGSLTPAGTCPPTILDLKKASEGGADDDDFSRSIDKYGYHVRAAFYCDAVEQITGARPNFIWIVVEDTYPFALSVLYPDQDAMSVGRIVYRECLDKYTVGMTTGLWPGYSNDVQAVGLPGYVLSKYKGLI